jgi:pimeloyl-ACP methyl ester carboxylesterase
VLALHGWLDNAASFDGLAPRLEGCQVVALDLCGHGLSDWRPPGVHYHFVDFVEDVVRVVDTLGWERFSMLGHSLGAGVASCAAAVIPDRVQRLALIEGLGPLSGKPEKGPAIHAQAIRQMSELGAKRAPLYPHLDAAARAREFAGDLGHAAARTLTERGTRPRHGGLAWRSDPRLTLRSPYYLSEAQVLAYLRAIVAPTRLVLAEQGLLATRANLQRRLAALSQLEVVHLPGGHHLHMEAPAAVAAELVGFLTGRNDAGGH